MSVVVWDGKTLAADRACFRSGLMSEVRKLVESDTHVAGFVGRYGPGREMAQWAVDGADPVTFDSDWKETEVLCVDKASLCAFLYDGSATPIPAVGPVSTGEAAAAAGALALVVCGVYQSREAVKFMVNSKRFDAVGFGVDSWP